MTEQNQLSDQQADYLYQKAGAAAYSAYRRREQLPDEWFEDAKQQAALTFWQKHFYEGYNPGYAFVAAYRQVGQHFFSRNKNPFASRVVSLDACDGKEDRPWLESLVAPSNGEPYHWRLTDDDIRLLLCQAFERPYRVKLERYVQLIRLLRQGTSNFSIAAAMGVSEERVKGMRKRLKAALVGYCERRGIPVPEYGPGGWIRAHEFADFHPGASGKG